MQYNGTAWVCATQSSGADNLGNHTATQNIKLSGNYLSNDGGNEGLYVSMTGNVGVGTATPSYKLDIAGTTSIADRTIAINATPTLYLPDQVNFVGSVAVGNGLRSLAHSSGFQGQYNTAV